MLLPVAEVLMVMRGVMERERFLGWSVGEMSSGSRGRSRRIGRGGVGVVRWWVVGRGEDVGDWFGGKERRGKVRAE